MIFLAFTIATALVCFLNAYGAWRDFIRFGDLLGASQLLMIALGYSVITHDRGHPWSPDNMIWLVLVDFGAVLASGFWFVTKREKWSFLLMLTYVAQLGVHAWFWSLSDHKYHAQYLYVALLNALAVLQLPIVGGRGAAYVAGKVGGLLFRRGDGRFGVGHGALP